MQEGRSFTVDNVTIYTFLFPIDQLHPDAARKSKQIWCAPDKAKAWDEFFVSGKVPDNKGDCGDPVAQTQAFGSGLKINATPTLVFADGTIVPGALPAAQIEKQFAEADAGHGQGGRGPPGVDGELDQCVAAQAVRRVQRVAAVHVDGRHDGDVR